MPIKLYLMRHGQTQLNQAGLVQGVTDGWLNTKGIRQVQAAAVDFQQRGLHFDLTFSSPSQRARQTAQIVLAAVNPDLPIQTLTQLSEVNFGNYESQLESDLAADLLHKLEFQPQQLQIFIQQNGWSKTLELILDTLSDLDQTAENYQMLISRLQVAMQMIIHQASRQSVQQVLIVAHGLSLLVLLSILDNSVILPQQGLDNASVSQVDYEDGIYQVVSINNTRLQ
ncbi:MAG: histidine phosphatase family protein [Lactobacillus sp.]|nr:histidine phosphatase family protein [Lactobacillus sp.]